MPDGKAGLTDDKQRQYVAALETLPLLTRTVFLLASRDSFPYAEIGWRCGISVDEVQIRVADALIGLARHLRTGPSFAGRLRRAVLPWRDAWATARARQGDR